MMFVTDFLREIQCDHIMTVTSLTPNSGHKSRRTNDEGINNCHDARKDAKVGVRIGVEETSRKSYPMKWPEFHMQRRFQ